MRFWGRVCTHLCLWGHRRGRGAFLFRSPCFKLILVLVHNCITLLQEELMSDFFGVVQSWICFQWFIIPFHHTIQVRWLILPFLSFHLSLFFIFIQSSFLPLRIFSFLIGVLQSVACFTQLNFIFIYLFHQVSITSIWDFSSLKINLGFLLQVFQLFIVDFWWFLSVLTSLFQLIWFFTRAQYF